MPLTILLCDDHTLIREGIAALLKRKRGWQVVAQAVDGEEAVRLAAEHRPDVAVLDVAMPGVNGIDAAAQIRKCSPGTKIVALSMYGDEHYLRRMLDAGADAYVLKNDAARELTAAVQAVLREETYVSAKLREQDPAQAQRSPQLDIERLTARERD